MKTLVVIPTLMLDCSFSAPLAWMFSKHVEHVEGVYGFELTKDLVQKHDQFIVELNWFIQLHEFGLIVDFIKTHNKFAKILFGGMHAGICFAEIFKRYEVDYFICGDNEGPIQQFLQAEDPKKIANFVGRTFQNPITYSFSEEQYCTLDFNLDWFPGYFKYRTKSDQFLIPHIVTFKGGCNMAHDGCDYCMGSKFEVLRGLYNRAPISMTDRSLKHILSNVQRRFKEASLYITRLEDYDFTNAHFDLDVTIEVDSHATCQQIKALLGAFRKVYLLLAGYDEGLSGEMLGKDRLQDILELEDENHSIRFYVLRKDATISTLPHDHILYSDFAFPAAASWIFYSDINTAAEFSRRFYKACNRHFVDGTPTARLRNSPYFTQCFRFSKGFGGTAQQ